MNTTDTKHYRVTISVDVTNAVNEDHAFAQAVDELYSQSTDEWDAHIELEDT